jgi:superfamily I DNA/RNA helicase
MSYYFQLPTFTQLTTNQKFALGEDEAISLCGGPGTGKTVVSLWRHIRNHELHGINSLLLTYTKTLQYYLIKTAEPNNKNAASKIDRTIRWSNHNQKAGTHYDEIIIDEAQDVNKERYQIIKRLTDLVSFGADDAQGVYKDGCTLNQLNNLFPQNEQYELAQNFRNSKEILLFVQSVFPNIYIPNEVLKSAYISGLKPLIQILGRNNFEELVVENILEIIEDFPDETHNIGILVPSIKMVNTYFALLRANNNCSMYHSELENFASLERIHITTFKSAKGLEFDTVIIPGFDSFKWFINNTDTFSENDYHVALTRSRRNLYLLCKYNINISSTNTYNKE